MKPVEIVLIEDNLSDVFLIEMALKENGIDYQLTHFQSGREAVRVLCGPGGADAALPGIILLDLNTPGSDGFSVLAELKAAAHLSGTEIAILTSSQALSDAAQASLLGTRMIPKRSDLDAFMATVGSAVRDMLPPENPPVT